MLLSEHAAVRVPAAAGSRANAAASDEDPGPLASALSPAAAARRATPRRARGRVPATRPVGLTIAPRFLLDLG